MTPIIDINDDGIDELMWGERCIRLSDGIDLFCADRDNYRGHSDVIQPFRHAGRWYIYTCRENDPTARPRIVVYNDIGFRVWGDLDEGHIDQGWVARLGDGVTYQAMGVRIDGKQAGPDGTFRSVTDYFVYDAMTGNRIALPVDPYLTIPVDLNNDGLHELVMPDGRVVNRHGDTLGQVQGQVALAAHVLDHPGEHLVTFQPDGTVECWIDTDAKDNQTTLSRYTSHEYVTNRRLTAVGYNHLILTGM